ncbi:hypothetical protein BGW80DRAFT_1291490 [Lactifluus volemus]|nr:hypothetical protein BGW80DRAFT_1291490 [Lactifluus volemus]
MFTSHSFFPFALVAFFALTSEAQLPDSSALLSSTSDITGSFAPSATSFANFTTTNAQGSMIVTSIPITVTPNTSSTASSSTPFPSLGGYTTCVVNCLDYAVARVNCTSVTAVACYCTSSVFPNALYTCVAANCSTSVPTAENLAQKFCAIDNTTLSFSSTAAPPPSTAKPLASSTSPGGSSPSGSSSSSKSPNAATSALRTPVDTRGWIVIACGAGAIFGATALL